MTRLPFADSFIIAELGLPFCWTARNFNLSSCR